MDILFGASLISEMKLHYRLGLSGKILVLCAYCHIDLKSPGFFIFFLQNKLIFSIDFNYQSSQKLI